MLGCATDYLSILKNCTKVFCKARTDVCAGGQARCRRFRFQKSEVFDDHPLFQLSYHSMTTVLDSHSRSCSLVASELASGVVLCCAALLSGAFVALVFKWSKARLKVLASCVKWVLYSLGR